MSKNKLKDFDPEYWEQYKHLYKIKKNIDKVTTQRLEMVLRMCGIFIDINIIDNIIDIVELIEEKGGKVNLKDVSKLKEKWDSFPI